MRTDDLPVVVAAVVLMYEELQRRRLGHVTRTASDRPGGVKLLCCGGHGLPPLCPSERSFARRARRAGAHGAHEQHSAFPLADSEFRHHSSSPSCGLRMIPKVFAGRPLTI